MRMFRDLCARACDDVHLLELCTDLLAARAHETEWVEDRERKEGHSSGHHATAPSGARPRRCPHRVADIWRPP
eukprot:6476794-Pyramimonas_sp.AAC.1